MTRNLTHNLIFILFPVSLVIGVVVISDKLLLSAFVIVLSLANTIVFYLINKMNRKSLDNYSKIITNNLVQHDEQTGSSDFLANHIASCKLSRQSTAAIIQENDTNSSAFAENFKESVFLTTTINGSVQSINHRIIDLNNSLQESSSAIEEISSTVLEFARQIENQSSSIIQTSTAMEEMDANIRNVSSITDKKELSSEQLINLAEKSQNGMQEMNKKIDAVNNSIGSVQEIINVIDSIASQTNLLSMNAAIEAAHAGEAGKGFAVVAGEIRKLAESTATNSRLISENLKKIVENVKDVKEAGKESSADFDSIKTEIEEMVRAFKEISSATSELSSGSNEIVSATQMLNDITSSISSGSKEISQSTADIRNSLTNIVGASQNSENEINNISKISQKLNVMFLSVSNAILKYEDNLDKIQEFQNHEFGAATKSFSAIKIILQHLIWIIKARGAIDETIQVDQSELLDHQTCSLGRWIETNATTEIKSLTYFNEMEKNHEELHKLVKEIITMKNELSQEEIEQKYNHLLQISTHIIDALIKLGEEYK